MRAILLFPLVLAATAFGQTLPPRPAAPPATATRPAGLPKNLDHALDATLNLDADALPLAQFADLLRDKTQTNIALNWNALALAGITRDTPVTLHLKGLTYEQVVRTLMEVIPSTGSRPNYAVGDNTLTISTNAEIGNGVASRLYDLSHAVSYSLTPQQTPAEREHNLQVVTVVLRSELLRAGEPMDFKGHELSAKDNMLVASVSERAQEFVNRALLMFNQPIKVGQLAGGTQLNIWSKRTSDAYKAFRAAPGAATPEAMARAPGQFSQFNIALLPGTQEELGKDKPDLRAAISDSGVLLLGPAEAIRARTLLVVYDLRDLMRKFSTRARNNALGAAEYQKAIVQVLQTTIKPEDDAWAGGEDLGKKPAIMIPFNGLLVVFATAETHRTVVAALQDMNK